MQAQDCDCVLYRWAQGGQTLVSCDASFPGSLPHMLSHTVTGCKVARKVDVCSILDMYQNAVIRGILHSAFHIPPSPLLPLFLVLYVHCGNAEALVWVIQCPHCSFL